MLVLLKTLIIYGRYPFWILTLCVNSSQSVIVTKMKNTASLFSHREVVEELKHSPHKIRKIHRKIQWSLSNILWPCCMQTSSRSRSKKAFGWLLYIQELWVAITFVCFSDCLSLTWKVRVLWHWDLISMVEDGSMWKC